MTNEHFTTILSYDHTAIPMHHYFAKHRNHSRKASEPTATCFVAALHENITRQDWWGDLNQ